MVASTHSTWLGVRKMAMGSAMGSGMGADGMPTGVKETRILRKHTSLQVSIPNVPGSLYRILDVFKKKDINLTRIETRNNASSLHTPEAVTAFLDFEGLTTDPEIRQVMHELQRLSLFVAPIESYAVPWFPRRLIDMQEFVDRCMMAGDDLEADHPGFHDKEYRQRREMIANIAFSYKCGDPIPRVNYTDNEKYAWKCVFEELMQLFSTHTCAPYQQIMPLLVENCGYRSDNIPQLGDVSDFLRSTTGFVLKPIAGLLSSRDFLNGLAFRVFHSTQYIRHHSKPLYTPEPDICHELLGHAPLLADPDFADFSQEIGLASLGVSDEAIEKLATCYWFTVEFGLCKQRGALKAYGAGLLSSFGELQYCLGPEPELKPFDPYVASVQPYPITKYQPVYFVSESFAKMKDQMIDFSKSLGRPFDVKYSPYNQTIEEVPLPRFH